MHAPPDAGEARAASGGAASAASGEAAGQWLFRAEIATAEGSASLRLVLRRFDSTHFQLTAADALGQVRWEIRRALDEAVWVVPQEHRYCRLDGRRALRSRQWVSSLSVLEVAGLLTGEWPPPGGIAGSSSPPTPDSAAPLAGGPAEGPAERRISGERGAAGWTSWTLWTAGEPAVWFQRQGAESLLSVRQPSIQFRWRLTAQGALDRVPVAGGEELALVPAELAASSREFACPENEIP